MVQLMDFKAWVNVYMLGCLDSLHPGTYSSGLPKNPFPLPTYFLDESCHGTRVNESPQYVYDDRHSGWKDRLDVGRACFVGMDGQNDLYQALYESEDGERPCLIRDIGIDRSRVSRTGVVLKSRDEAYLL